MVVLKQHSERKAPRVDEVLTAYFYHNGQTIAAVARKFTEYGLFLQTQLDLPLSHILTIELEAPHGTVMVEGQVISLMKSGKTSSLLDSQGVGIAISAPSDEYRQWVEHMRGGKLAEPSHRKEQRFSLSYRVHYASKEDFLAEYTANLSRGGAFIQLSTPLPPGTNLRLRLDIPGAKETVEVTGRVAYALDAVKARKAGKTPGMGVQFVELSSQARDIIQNHLQQLDTFRRKLEARTDEVPIHGSLASFLVPELLLRILEHQSTGSLKVEHEDVVKRIYFDQGHAVYVESEGDYETLSNYLVACGYLTPSDVAMSLAEHSRDELHHGELLIRGGMIDSAVFSKAFIDYNEQKIKKTFAWFTGTFEFIPMERSGWRFRPLPLRTYNIIFSGIRDWYDPALIQAWMGISPASKICLVATPRYSMAIPKGIGRILDQLAQPKTVAQLTEILDVSEATIITALFTMNLAGWVVVDVAEANPLQNSETFNKPLTDIEQKIMGQYRHMLALDFYEILGVTVGIHQVILNRRFMEIMRQFGLWRKEESLQVEVVQHLKHMEDWARVAYQTLRHPQLRKIYSRRRTISSTSDKAQQHHADYLLFSSIQLMDNHELLSALELLESGRRQFPDDGLIQGYLGWVLFQLNPDSNIKRAVMYINEAIEKLPTEPELRYFRGKFYAFDGRWDHAEHALAMALKFDPQMAKATTALMRVRSRQRNPDPL